MMMDQMRSALQLAQSVVEIPKKRAEKIARQMMGGGNLKSTQVGALAEDIVKRSKQNAQMIQSVVSSEIRRQLKTLGVATRDDIERLSRRLFGLATKDDIDRLSKRLAAVEEKAKAPARATAAKPRSKAPAPAKKPQTPPPSGSPS